MNTPRPPRTELPKGSAGGLWRMVQTPTGYRKELCETVEEAAARLSPKKPTSPTPPAP